MSRGKDEEPAELVGGEIAYVVTSVFDEGGMELPFGYLPLKDLLLVVVVFGGV